MLKYLAAYSYWFGPLRVFDSITFRALIGVSLGFFLALVAGKPFIRRMRRLRATENVDKPQSATLHALHAGKRGTPTMGGAMLLLAVFVATALACDPTNLLVLTGLALTAGFGLLGFADDYVKLTHPARQGLGKRQKLAWQCALATAAAICVWYAAASGGFRVTDVTRDAAGGLRLQRVQAGHTALLVPFSKWKDVRPRLHGWYYIFFVLVIVASSNAVNLTDGLDGLASGCTIMVAATYAVFAYAAGNAAMSMFFRIPFVPGSGELAIFCAVIVGAVMGFLWFNAHPAEVFLGDTGSLALGAAIGYVALVTKHELILLLAGGIFVIEAASVLLQVIGFRLWGRRIFKCAPFHHHLEFCGWHENKVVVRLWMIGVILAATALGTLKMH